MIKIGLVGIVVLGALLVYGGSSTYAKEETAIPVYSYDLPTVTPTPAPTATPTVLERLKAENEEKERERRRDEDKRRYCEDYYFGLKLEHHFYWVDFFTDTFSRCFDKDGNWKWASDLDPETLEKMWQHINGD